MELSIIGLWQASGPVGHVVAVALLVLSLLSLAVGIERWIVVQRAARGSTRFLAAWRVSLERPWGAAVEVARGPGDDSPAAFLLRALGEILDGGMPPEVAERAYDRTVRRVLLGLAERLRRGLGLLASVGSTAPFIGLFGTVMGIVNAFHQMAATGQGGLATVSGGIAEALVTTALGILAALPALWLYNAITSRIAALLGELECAAEELAVKHLVAEHAAGPAAVRLHSPRAAAGATGRAARLASASGRRES